MKRREMLGRLFKGAVAVTFGARLASERVFGKGESPEECAVLSQEELDRIYRELVGDPEVVVFNDAYESAPYQDYFEVDELTKGMVKHLLKREDVRPGEYLLTPFPPRYDLVSGEWVEVHPFALMKRSEADAAGKTYVETLAVSRDSTGRLRGYWKPEA